MRIMRISWVVGADPVARCSRLLIRESRLEMTSLSCLSSSSTKPMAAVLGVVRGGLFACVNEPVSWDQLGGETRRARSRWVGERRPRRGSREARAWAESEAV